MKRRRRHEIIPIEDRKSADYVPHDDLPLLGVPWTSRVNTWRQIKKGFPKPIKIGKRLVWARIEVVEYFERLKAQR